LVFAGGSSTSKPEEVKRLPGGKVKKKVRLMRSPPPQKKPLFYF